MKIAYFDCFAGASGDMILGTLVDAGVPLEVLKQELEKLNLSGFRLQAEKVQKKHLGATSITVSVEGNQPERHLTDIQQIIQRSHLSPNVKVKSIQIFQRLAQAEAKIHQTTPEKIHFHEVGAVDAIVDTVGAVIGLEYLNIQQLFVSAFPISHGFVDCAHGKLPLPAPATVELLKGFSLIPRDVEGELVTPTGAAILSTLAQPGQPLPEIILEKVGYGAGEKDFPFPNLLRMFIGVGGAKQENYFA